jgi:hypothetical protein
MADSPTAEDPRPDEPDGIDAGAGDPGIVPWVVVVVRAWAHEGRRVVRMTLSGPARTPEVCYEQSGEAAGRRLTGWLDDVSDRPTGSPPSTGSGDGPETPGRRTDIAAPPTVAEGTATAIADCPSPPHEP